MNNANGKILLMMLFLGSLALAQTSPSVVADEVYYSQSLYYNHASRKTIFNKELT